MDNNTTTSIRYETLDSYIKEKTHLIAIDSDGCVFDNMTVKHQQYFFPQMLKAFELEDPEGTYARKWDEINLDYPLRGINRFLGLGKLLEAWDTGYDTSAYMQWLTDSPILKNNTLSERYEATGDEVLGRALTWSNALNADIKENLKEVSPFEGVTEAIEMASEVADVVVMSSANHDAILREWEEAGILKYVRFVSSQDTGSKQEVLGQLMAKGYHRNNMLMVGDARGDYLAAKANGIHYHQITYKKEVASWSAFKDSVLSAFMDNAYLYDGPEVLEMALEDALKVIKGNVDDYTDHFQHVSVEGVYPKEFNKLWTMSFYPGELYLAYEMTKDQSYIRNREAILGSFRQRCDEGHMATHDIGFLFELTAYYDYLATGDEASRQLVIDAADKLMLRYNEKGGYIQAWGAVNPEDTETRIIIDCMMNLPLLHIASKLTGDKKYSEAAKSHAYVSSKTLVRPDSSTYHTYWMSTVTGEALRGKTHQGHQDESTWARGQGWSVYGFYKSYEWTKDLYLLDVALRSADVFLANLPKNDTCYWDFDFTDDNPDIRDTSAASITAAGLLKIGQCADVKNRDKYWNAGVAMIKQLANRYQNNEWTQGCGILREGMYHRDQGFNEYTSWGDYYYVEALSTFFKTVE